MHEENIAYLKDYIYLPYALAIFPVGLNEFFYLFPPEVLEISSTIKAKLLFINSCSSHELDHIGTSIASLPLSTESLFGSECH